MTTAPTSYGPQMTFTQNEATAAQATWVFHLVKSADSTDATALVPVMTISKAGGAFAAPNAGTVITELTNGWYKVVHNAADFDTVGVLACRIAVATADTLNICHEVRVLDQNVATVNPGASGIDVSSFTTSALNAMGTPLNAVVKTFTLSADGDAAISMFNAANVTIEITGTFGGGSAQIQTTEDPTVAVPVWTNQGAAVNASNAANPNVVTGPHNAVRVHFTGSTAPALAVKYTIRKPQGL